MIQTMKAITDWQPWASLIAVGAKQYETRGWATKYRGQIAIHAGKTMDHWYADCNRNYLRAVYGALKPIFYPNIMCNQQDLQNAAPYGAIVATAELVGCHEIKRNPEDDAIYIRDASRMFEHYFSPTDNEYRFGDFSPGRYAWELANVKMLETPIPAKGRQGLWNWQYDDEVVQIGRGA